MAVVSHLYQAYISLNFSQLNILLPYLRQKQKYRDLFFNVNENKKYILILNLLPIRIITLAEHSLFQQNLCVLEEVTIIFNIFSN